MRALNRSISRLQSFVLQRGLGEQQVSQASPCITQLSDLQQLAVAALGVGANSSSSNGSSASQWSSVRGMAGSRHKLSLKKANNKASWLAAAPYLPERQQQQQQDQLQQQQQPVLQSAIPPLPVLEEPVLYHRIGRITGPYRVGTQPCFAVMESGGSQWKVTADDVIYHNKIPGARVNDVLQFNKVLLLGTREDTTIGRPFLPGASVVAAVEETFKDSKVRVFKKKVRKRYSKLRGHRSHITALRILEVRQPQAEPAALEAEPAAAAAVTNVAAIGPSSTRALALGRPRPRRLAPQRQGRRSSRNSQAGEPQLGSAAAAEGAEAGQQQGVWQRVPLRDVGEGRQHGPPAVMQVLGASKPGSTAAQ